MAEETQPPMTGEPVPRSFRITEELLQKFDYTKGCPKCGAMKRDEKSDTLHHSKLCRSRVEDEIKKDDVLSRKLAGVEERKTQFLARKVEESDRRRVEERDSEEQNEHVGVLATPSVKPVATPDSGRGVAGGEESDAIDKICSWVAVSYTHLRAHET